MIDITKPQKEYELIDSGEGEKLERFGDFVLRRPDPQALWNKRLAPKVWADAHASFVRSGNVSKWLFKEGVPKDWNISYNDLGFNISPTPFKHTGIFPEQIVNWRWTQEKVESRKRKVESQDAGVKEIQILNLFGYTGGASLACAKAGANVCHVDASKSSIAWARENAKLSGLENAPIRWILEDAYEFVRKEIKRGKKYDGIIMDPPAFGHGPNGEMWRIEECLIPFLEDTKKLLSDTPIFFIVNGYASGYSSVAYRQNITDLVEKFGGTIEDGELAIAETGSDRLLPSGIFARWSRE
jgi:23S rRNA (cytosine1962-C5)-methyltransferase